MGDTAIATDQGKIAVKLERVEKVLEFEISFQVTNKHLENANVEGRSFYGT